MSVLLRSALEGYEPYGAGVKQGQNNFCNENRAIVSTLDFGPQHNNIKKIVVSVQFENILLTQTTNLKYCSFMNIF